MAGRAKAARGGGQGSMRGGIGRGWESVCGPRGHSISSLFTCFLVRVFPVLNLI